MTRLLHVLLAGSLVQVGLAVPAPADDPTTTPAVSIIPLPTLSLPTLSLPTLSLPLPTLSLPLPPIVPTGKATPTGKGKGFPTGKGKGFPTGKGKATPTWKHAWLSALLSTPSYPVIHCRPVADLEHHRQGQDHSGEETGTDWVILHEAALKGSARPPPPTGKGKGPVPTGKASAPPPVVPPVKATPTGLPVVPSGKRY
ncbi:hypothetical protein PG996_001250 [Apiospora saccharicola]|uniref:Uncharacterized protein n=1 Tax=Apiospora saccharicola TaxID=335842 RepID=A0ABR1WG32_9PEZI